VLDRRRICNRRAPRRSSTPRPVLTPGRLAAALLCGLALAGAGAETAQAKRKPTTIKVLSNRADLISGGDALVEMMLPRRARRWKVKPDPRSP
jgi:hypothetical protein